MTGNLLTGNLLVSFAEGIPTVEKALAIPGARVLLDSGAFANFTRGRDVVTLDQYRGFLCERGREFWRYFSLDKIADPKVSRANLDALLTAGLTPVPVFQRGDNLAELERLKRIFDLIAIGGIAGRLNRTLHRDYLHQVVRASAGHRLHLLGCGGESVLRTYRPYSCDSSNHATRYGVCYLRYGCRFYTLQLKSGRVLLHDKPVQAHRALFARICEDYQLSADKVLQRSFYMSEECKTLMLRAYLRYAGELKRIGIEYFSACVDHDVSIFARALGLEQERYARMHAAA